jgi:hypothetical protein
MALYVYPDMKSKKHFKEQVEAQNRGEIPTLRYAQVGPFGGNEATDGIEYFEGPHYPKPHTWYAKVLLKDGKIVKVF